MGDLTTAFVKKYEPIFIFASRVSVESLIQIHKNAGLSVSVESIRSPDHGSGQVQKCDGVKPIKCFINCEIASAMHRQNRRYQDMINKSCIILKDKALAMNNVKT